MKYGSIHSRIDFIPADLEHGELLFRWRNDPDTRANSFNQDEIGFDDHMRWLSRVTKPLSGMDLWIALKDASPIGTVRVSDINNEVSCTLAPEYRGKGLGKEMLCIFMKDLGDRPFFCAKIKYDNNISEKTFAAAGFKPFEDGKEFRLWVWARLLEE